MKNVSFVGARKNVIHSNPFDVRVLKIGPIETRIIRLWALRQNLLRLNSYADKGKHFEHVIILVLKLGVLIRSI